MKKIVSLVCSFLLAASWGMPFAAASAEETAAKNAVSVDDNGAVRFSDVQDNMKADGANPYYPNMIYKEKLTGEYSVYTEVFKLNNGGVDWLFTLGLDENDVGGYNLNSEGIGFCTNGAGIILHERPEDSPFYITIYKVDEDGKKTDDYATPNCVKDVIDGWADNVDIAYKFEVRSDGTIGLYYDLRVTENACTTLRNIVVIENDDGDNLNADFSYTDGYFGFMPNTNKAFTEGYPAYNPLNLWMYKYSVKQGDKEDTSDFKNYTEKWNFVTEAPVRSYTVTVTGGTADLTSAQAGQTITLTASAAPEGKAFDYWTVNGTKIDGNTFEMPAENAVVAAVYKDNASENSSANSSAGNSESDGGGCGSIVGGGFIALLCAGAAVVFLKKKV